MIPNLGARESKIRDFCTSRLTTNVWLTGLRAEGIALALRTNGVQ
jgi:hypothetical protein